MEELEFVPAAEKQNGACQPLETPESSLPIGDVPKPKHVDLAARAVVPVKAEYLRLAPSRSSPNVVENKKSDGENGVPVPPSSVVVSEKKSKRQMKRERQQEQKSSKNICPEIAKTGKVDACRFGGSCRFSHDLEGFLLQKPDDLPGVCPFMELKQSCPYGLACRLYGSHKEFSASESADPLLKNQGELNFLNKDFQRLLWKNKVKYPKADAQLKSLGLSVGKNPKSNPDNAPEQNPADLDESNDCSALSESEACPRPSKKIKNSVDDNGSLTEVDNDSEDKSMLVNPCPGTKVEIIPKLNGREKKIIDFRGKPYLAPLTTVGNLPFRRVCKGLGADITCGEMAMCTNLLQGQASEWALLRRHQSEDIFGVQICGSYPDTISRTVEIIEQECSVDFIDINMGCPIDVVVNKGAGSSLLTKPMRMKSIIQAASRTTDLPLTLKVRTGFFEGRNRIHSLIAEMSHWGMSALTIHGRSRQQRYSKLADWDYINDCVGKGPDNLQIIGNGDIFSYVDWNTRMSDCPQLSSCMIARGALIKPWIFTEIKEQRHWDISSGERLGILKDFVKFGLQHWGSDNKGVETTRHFLLEWLGYTHRYVPVGILEVVPQRLNWRPPSYFGRDDLETLMASESAADWIRISEMLLGKVPAGFSFAPKHKSNAYDRAENG